jgi:adenine C2-methylase RlmN of 23S rRNA A2503 and tRNA A37
LKRGLFESWTHRQRYVEYSFQVSLFFSINSLQRYVEYCVLVWAQPQWTLCVSTVVGPYSVWV